MAPTSYLGLTRTLFSSGCYELRRNSQLPGCSCQLIVPLACYNSCVTGSFLRAAFAHRTRKTVVMEVSFSFIWLPSAQGLKDRHPCLLEARVGYDVSPCGSTTRSEWVLCWRSICRTTCDSIRHRLSLGSICRTTCGSISHNNCRFWALRLNAAMGLLM